MVILTLQLCKSPRPMSLMTGNALEKNGLVTAEDTAEAHVWILDGSVAAV